MNAPAFDIAATPRQGLGPTPAPAWLLIARNLRAGERTSGLFWLRAGMVGAMLLALVGGYSWRGGTGGPGGVLLRWLIEIDYWAMLIAGISLFPVLIAEEREQGTLSLLRLAGFRPLGFLLGQTLSAFVGCLLLLAVQVPFLLLAVTLGGTSAQQVGIAVLILLLHAGIVYGAALLAGAMSRTSREAVQRAALFVALVTFLPRWLERQLGGATGGQTPLSEHLAPSLLSKLFENSLSSGALLTGIAIHLGVAVAAGLAAWWLFDPSGERGHARRRAPAAKIRPRQPRFPAGDEAFEALAARLAFGNVPMLRWLWAVHLPVAVLVLSIRGRSLTSGPARALVTVQCGIALVHVAIIATRCMQSVRRERIAGLLLLAGGPHVWLARQRVLRLRVFGVHLLAMLVTTLAMSSQLRFFFPEAMLIPLGWVLCAGFFADRFGEYCGLAFARGALAITVLGGGAAILLLSSGGIWGAPTVGCCSGFVLAAGVPLALLGAIVNSATTSRLPGLYAA